MEQRQRRFYRARDLVGTVKTRKHGDRGLLGIGSPAWLWVQVHRGDFPQPVKLSDGVTAFDADEVDAWIEERKASRAAAAA